MVFVLVAHGLEPIPSKGWGAVEHVIWQYAQRLEARGHTVHIVNEKGFKAVRAVAALCSKEKIDVVHSHAEKPVRWLAFLAKRFRFLLMSTTHNPFQPPRLNKTEEKALRRCHFAPYHLVLRPDVIPLIQARNPKAVCRVRVNGVETEHYQRHSVGNGKAIYLGRIQERKRQNHTALLLDGSDIECDFVGPLLEEVEISDALRYRMRGEWDRETLYRRLGEYSCLILLSESEGQPLVVIEALAAGIPVVVSPAAAGNLDLDQPFIHVVKTDEELLPKVRLAIEQRDRLSDAIRAYAEEAFDYERVVDGYLKTVNEWKS